MSISSLIYYNTKETGMFCQSPCCTIVADFRKHIKWEMILRNNILYAEKKRIIRNVHTKQFVQPSNWSIQETRFQKLNTSGLFGCSCMTRRRNNWPQWLRRATNNHNIISSWLGSPQKAQVEPQLANINKSVPSIKTSGQCEVHALKACLQLERRSKMHVKIGDAIVI